MWVNLLKKWWFWVLSIFFIIGISYAFYNWQFTPGDIIQITVSATIGLVSFIGNILKIRKELQSERGPKSPLINEENIFSDIANDQQGNQNIQFNQSELQNPLTIDQSKHETHNYYQRNQPELTQSTPHYTPPSLPPSEQLPNPDSLSPGSYLPFLEDRDFTGREEYLFWLARNLIYSQKTKPAVVIHGIGGQGKTHLAIRYCQLYGQYYQGVHWINAKEDFDLGIATCGEKMNIEPWPQEIPDQVRLTRTAWEKSPPRLIVLDDVIGPNHLLDLLKEFPNSHILTTSRCETWPTGLPIEIRDLDQMTLEEARTLLRRLSPRLINTQDSILDTLTSTLGLLPLALYLAGCYLRDREDLSVEDYIHHLSEVETLFTEHEFDDWTDLSLSEHTTSLLATFEVSWQMLEEKQDAKTAKILFQAFGYCVAGIPIPYEFIHSLKYEDWVENSIALGVRSLKSVGLIETYGQDILVHPLLADYARIKDSLTHGLDFATKSYGELTFQLLQSGDPRTFSKHFAHLRNIAAFSEEKKPDQAARLCSHLGSMNRKLANFSSAKDNFEKALALDIKFYGEEHPYVATDLNNLGGILKAMGDLPAAKANLEKALALDIQFYGEEHPEVATDLNNLGVVLEAMGDLPAAKANFEKALNILNAKLPLDHPNTQIVKTSLELLKRLIQSEK